ncbi:MAG: hypothetical protein KDE59_00165 [Anaerolineales bacterium]|nr:hypothetical protein [Anaerolineales bacterium]
MILLRIEHPVPDFDAWKVAFDSDPVNRRKSGVKTHRVLRLVENPCYAIIDLEFETQAEAEALLNAMQQVWQRVAGSIMSSPQWQFSEIIEAKVYENGPSAT